MLRSDKIADHLSRIYVDTDINELTAQIMQAMQLDDVEPTAQPYQNKWDQSDIWLITYGDSVRVGGSGPDTEPPLETLKKCLDLEMKGVVSGVHILPFFPYSSDDGFSVIDYAQVNESLGDWSHIEAIGADYDLMADLVINHCSARSRWFDNFKQNKAPGKGYFKTASPDGDLSKVVRPRTSPLLREVRTTEGTQWVWCTFSHDQVDLDFENPQVLIEMVQIVRRYLEQGVRIFRLDAVAFLWKDPSTNSIHLPQTHEMVRLFRTLIEEHSPSAIIITETNVPNDENLSYLGNGNEAHGVYNFSLPPLLLQALVSGTSKHLKQWQMSMPPAQNGTFFFNFIASHDGIGLRPAEGLLDDQEIDQLVTTMENFGGRISWRTIDDRQRKPYEINIALFDAMKGTHAGPDQWQVERFLCAHTIMLALEGIPGIYLHSFTATGNDYEKLALTQHNRSINRHRWELDKVIEVLENPETHNARVFNGMKQLLRVRRAQPAFHPNAVHYTLHLSDDIFAFWRQSPNRDQSIFCLNNVSNKSVDIPLSSINLITLDNWMDLLTRELIDDLSATVTLEPYQCMWIANKEGEPLPEHSWLN